VTDRRYLLVLPVAALMLASAPRGGPSFFDDVKRTFQTDIPHFFPGRHSVRLRRRPDQRRQADVPRRRASRGNRRRPRAGSARAATPAAPRTRRG